MKTQAMKRSVLALAALFAVSTGALAEATKAPVLTDAQLDQVTAGGAMSSNIVFNPGKAQVLHVNKSGSHATCINCLEVGITNPPAGTSGMVTVMQPNKSEPTVHFIRKNPGF